MAVFGGIFSRKDKKSAQDQSPAVPASPIVSLPSPTTLKKPSPLPKSYNNTSPDAPRERSHRHPTKPSWDANRAFAGPREHRRDVEDDDATTTAEGSYVLPLIDSPSLMNGTDGADYFSPTTPSSSKPLAKNPATSNTRSTVQLLPSVNLSPISLPMTVEEDEDETPLGLRVGKPSRSTPPAQVVASAGSGNSDQPRGHARQASSLERLTLPTISTDVASSVRSLPLNSPTSPATSARRRPGIPTNMLGVPRPSSPTASSTSHFPVSPSSVAGSDSTRPTSPTSTRSKSTIPKFGGPLLKFSSRDPPPQLNAESESRYITKAERAKSKEREKANGSGMFSFMRDRKKSSPNPTSPVVANDDAPSPGGNPPSRGSLELLGRISFSSSKSESHAKHKDSTPPPPVPPLPLTTSLDTLPPLRPIPVDRRPSVEKGFVPPARRKYVPPANGPASPQEADEKDGKGKQGSFELVSFRHVRPVSPGPGVAVGAARSTSPGPFQGLELTVGRDRSGSFASDTSATKTTVSAFRQAQQRRGTGMSSAMSEGRRSTADLLEEAETRKSMTLDSLPLPGPPAPAPVDLPEPVRPYAAVGGASPRGSLDGGSRPSTPPVRPPRTNPPPGVRGASPVNHRDKIGGRGGSTPRKGAATQSAYGQLYSSTTSSDEDDSDDDDSSDDDVPLGARGKGPGPGPKKVKEKVSRKTTITQKNAPSTTSLVENDDDDDHRPSKRDTIIAPKQAQTSSHIRAPAAAGLGRGPPPVQARSGSRTPASASNTPAGRSASATPAPAATVPLGTPIARPHKPGVVVPPPRSSSLFVDTKRPASTALLESTTSPTSTITSHNRAHSASLLGGGLAGYAMSKASKSLGSVHASSPSPTATSGKRPMPPPLPKSKARITDLSTSDESDSEKSSSDDDDDAPLGLLKRPGSSLSMRSEGWGTKSELNHGVANNGGRRPALKNGGGSSSNSSGSTPAVLRPPPRDARRPPPPGPSSSLSNGPSRPSATNAPSHANLPPMRPFAAGMGMNSPSFYASSPGGSSNGDSYGSSTRLPLTPRDGSELGTASGSSQLSGKKEGAQPTASAMAGKKPYHGRKSSVTFEELADASERKSSEEEKRKERRREEAKAAIQMGKVINGPPPQLSDDETDLYTMQQSRLAGMPNLGANGVGAPGMNMAWDPQMFMMMQAQQAQMMAAAMGMNNMGNDPNYMAHQQAILFAKQAYQLAVAQQAMDAAGEEWERASNVNGPAGGSVSGASMLGGAGGLGGGMPPFMGMGNPGMMGMPMGMGMGMPMMNMGMGMGMPGMLFPPAPSSAYGGSAYGGSTAGSVYGGGSRIRQNFPSSQSVMGDPAPSDAGRPRKPRNRTVTAPSNAPLPPQHSSRLPPPPSSWKP